MWSDGRKGPNQKRSLCIHGSFSCYCFRTLRGVGPRVAEHALDAMPLNPFPLYEEIKLKP